MGRKNNKNCRNIENLVEENEKNAHRPLHPLFKIAIGIAALVGGFMIYDAYPKSKVHSEESRPAVLHENNSQIALGSAVRYEGLRQRYLDQLLEKEAKDSEYWKGFGGFVYDPGFLKFNELKKTKKEEYNSSSAYDSINVGSTPIATTVVEKRGEKPICYISEKCFDTNGVRSEDELKSVLDHESLHAYEGWKMSLPLKIDLEGMDREAALKAVANSRNYPGTCGLAIEAMCFDHQYDRIINEDRKVEKGYFARFEKIRKGMYIKLEEISRQDNDEGNFAKIILHNLKLYWKN